MNATDLLWLLLPLAVVSGWLAAKVDQKRHARSSLDLPSAYFKGLNFLLNEQPDKAIEVFIRVLEVNSDTVETHLALGNLFRRRGEVERAIRVHQNLIARPTLDKEQRCQALLELGQDYFKAGLLDRAENLFLELVDVPAYSEQALKPLLHIYQQEKDWEKAITVARKLVRVVGKKMDETIAQFYCELADLEYTRKNYAVARNHLESAFSVDPACVRASILLGDIAMQEGKYHEAIDDWRHIEQQDIHYLGEVAGRIAEGFRQMNDTQGLHDYFQSALQRHGSVALALAFADVIISRDGVSAAEKFIVEWLRRTPNVHGLHKLLELNIAKAPASGRNDLLLLKGIIEELRAQHLGYACGHCGFKGKKLHWLCPGCNRWNTTKPVQEE